MVLTVTYTLSPNYPSGISGATVQYNNGLLFDILAALVTGGGNSKGVGGSFSVTDPGLISALDSDSVVVRSGSSGTPVSNPGPAPIYAGTNAPSVAQGVEYV